MGYTCTYEIKDVQNVITLCAKLSSAVYCNRSCLWVCLCVFVCLSVCM